jgi:manganese efflux pump family protein
MNFSLIISAILLGVGLAMDAFAVSICKGLAVGKVKMSHMAIAGAWFGGFQMLMPLIGYFLGSSFHSYIAKFDHWVACILLVLIGANMLREALSKKEDDNDTNASFGFKTMFVMAVATSIDALAVGIALAMEENTNIWLSVTCIGVITFILSAIGVKIGSVFGDKYKKKAEIVGGVILIVLGLKILIEHLVGAV